MKKKLQSLYPVFGLLCLPALLAVVVTFSNCAYNPQAPYGAALTVGATDQIILRAEQTAQSALATFTLLVHLERDNETLLKDVSPEIHNYANKLRDNGPGWIRDLRNATKTFKANRNAENQATLLTALAVVNEALGRANTYIAQSKKALGQ